MGREYTGGVSIPHRPESPAAPALPPFPRVERAERPRAATGLGRALNWLFALLGGVLVALVGTVAHMSVASVGDAVVPIGLAMALIATAAYMIGVRLLLVDRGAVFAAGVGLVGTIALFTGRGPGGAVLINDSLASLVWTLAPVLVATLVVAWPRFSRPSRAGDDPRAPGTPQTPRENLAPGAPDARRPERA